MELWTAYCVGNYQKQPSAFRVIKIQVDFLESIQVDCGNYKWIIEEIGKCRTGGGLLGFGLDVNRSAFPMPARDRR